MSRGRDGLGPMCPVTVLYARIQDRIAIKLRIDPYQLLLKPYDQCLQCISFWQQEFVPKIDFPFFVP